MPPARNEDEGIQRLKSAIYSRKYSDDIKPRARHELDFPEPEVANDWQHQSDATDLREPPLQRIMLPVRSRTLPILKWVFGAAMVFFLGSVAFFIYYLYFGGFSSISARNIDIVITGPVQIAGGEPVNLEVTVTNRNHDALQVADLVATFPLGTRLDPSSCAIDSCRVSLGSIPSGGTAVIKLPAVYEGSAGSHASVGVQVQYQLAGSNSTFTASSNYGFTYSSSPISIAVDGNAETVSGQPMQITLTISSNSSQPIPQVVVQANYPFGFTPSTVDPAAASSGLWQLGSLMPGERKTISIQGMLVGETNESKNFHFAAGTPMGATSTSAINDLSDVDLPVTVAEPFLNLALTVDDASSTKGVVVAPGQLVTVAVNYKNNLTTEIDNAVVVAKLSGLSINGQTIQSENGFYRSTDNVVLWDKTTTQGELAAIPAGGSGRLTFNFLIPTSTALVGIQNPAIVISVNAAGSRLGQSGVPQNLQSAITQKVTVASDLQIFSQGLYFTNPFGVSGNMPPKAEQETLYAVVLSITNTTNTINGAAVTADLPPYVRLVGNHYLPQSEKVSFNVTTGQFSWNVGDIAAGAGLNGAPPRRVVIELGLTPSTSQIGSIPTLLQNIKLTGVDSLTGQSVLRKASDVTTSVTGDPGFSSVCAKVVSSGAVGTAASCN